VPGDETACAVSGGKTDDAAINAARFKQEYPQLNMSDTINIDLVEQPDDCSVLNRLFIKGPLAELERFKKITLREEVCPCCSRRHLILETPLVTSAKVLAQPMNLVLDEHKLLILENELPDKLQSQFVADLAAQWPLLEFVLEHWADAGVVLFTSENEPASNQAALN
jgi:hypothetical protein